MPEGFKDDLERLIEIIDQHIAEHPCDTDCMQTIQGLLALALYRQTEKDGDA